MKKNNAILSSLAVFAMTLFSCAKVETEVESPEIAKGVPFEIVAGTELTKTSNDGLDISWLANDAINLFHAETTKSSYGVNDQFTITSENLAASIFTGTLSAGALDGEKSYDWYALYPYEEHITTPNNTSAGYLSIGSADMNTAQVQAGNNSMAHLSGQFFPLYGKVTNVAAATTPNLTLKPALSIMKIHVTNAKMSAESIRSIAVYAPEAIAGQFYIKFTDDAPVFTAKSSSTTKTARLNVTSGASLTNGEAADFYIAVKPFTATAGSKLTIVVNGYSKTVTLGADFEFEPGKIHNINFSYNPPAFDQLVYSTLGISGSAYTSWSSVNGTYSNAIYAGQSYANENNYIQLRNTSPSGIVSTTSGGKVTKVAIAWNESTTDARTVTVYGKNTPYSGPADLYNEGTRGTSLGTIVKGTSTELTVSGYYEYVGLLASGALYMDEVDITWGAAKTKIAAPTGVAASETSGGTITVTWTDVPSGVAKYIVTCTGEDSKDVLPGVQAAAFSDLMNGNYEITVQAVPTDTENYSNSDIVTISDVAVTSGLSAPVYTLTPVSTGGNSSPHNSYTAATDIDITDGSTTITWNVMANSNMTPWRFGGKSITDTDRALYSKTALTENIKKIEVNSGTASSITINSLTISVHNSASDAASGDSPVASQTFTKDIVNDTVVFNKADATSWAGKYYRIVYNVTVSGNNNKYITLNWVKFYDK